MRFAYADPPYYKCAVKFYGDHPEAHVYDTIPGHQKLVADLTHGGYEPGDEMHDLFPGTGGMAEAVARREIPE